MDITKRNKLVALGLIVLSLLCCIYALSLRGSKDKTQEETRQKNVVHEITEGEPVQMTDSKIQGYSTATSEAKEDTTDINITTNFIRKVF